MMVPKLMISESVLSLRTRVAESSRCLWRSSLGARAWAARDPSLKARHYKRAQPSLLRWHCTRRMVNFRKSVTHKADRVWDNNYGKDLYTGKRRDHYEGENVRTEVDHIMECQLGEHMWEKAFDGRMTTRSR